MIFSVLDISILVLFFLIPIYTDLKYLKVKNNFLGVFFILAFLYLILKYLMGVVSLLSINILIINFVITLVFSFFLWIKKYISAGDAKMISVAALLIPYNFFNVEYINHFYFFSIFANIFILAFIFVLFISFFSKKKNKLKVPSIFSFEPRKKIKQVLTELVLLFYLIFFYQTLHISTLILLFFVVFLFSEVESYIEKKVKSYVYFSSFFVFLLFLLIKNFDFHIEMFVYLIVLRVFIRLVRIVLLDVNLKRAHPKKISELKLGQVIASSNSKLSSFYIERRLSSSDIVEIKKKISNKAIVFVEHPIPFTVFIVVGFVITILLKGMLIVDYNFFQLFFK